MTDAVVNYLDERLDDYLADLRLLSGMDSYSLDRDDVNTVVDWLEARLISLGFSIERFPHENAGDDLLALRQGRGSGKVMLLGHSDVVFPRGTSAQRPLTIDGDKVLGPGTCDMKAGLLAGIYAVETLDKVGFDNYGEIRFLVVSDEEINERHSIPLIRAESRKVDAVLTLEAARANGDVVIARKGQRWFIITAHGHPAHAGVEPEKGRNAVVAMARHVDALAKLNDPARDITVNVGVFNGGQQPNIVPDYARVELDVRAYDKEHLVDVTNAILKQFEQETVPGVTFDVWFEEASPCMPCTQEVEQLEATTKQIAAELGFAVKGAATGGAADSAFAADEGVPILDGLGPIGGLDHGPDEYILLSSIVPRTALLARLIQAIVRNAN